MSESDADRAGHQEQVARLAADVAARLGPDPQSEITAHLARIAARQAPDPGPALDAARRALEAAPGVPDRDDRRSRAALAQALAQLTDEVAGHRRALESLLAALADSFRPATHTHADIEGELDALHDRFASAERLRAWTPTDLDLSTRLGTLERSSHDVPFTVADAGHVPAELATERERVTEVLRRVVGGLDGPVVSLGALADAALDGTGPPVAGRGAGALDRWEPGALGGVVLAEVDHHAPGAVRDLVLAAARALRPGGRLVLSAADPSSPAAQRGILHLDPDRRSTVHPMALQSLCTSAGFGSFEVEDADRDPTSGPQHFVAVARR